MRRSSTALLSCLIGAGLIVSGLSPAWSAEGGTDTESAAVAVGGFALGDGLEASIDEHAGSLAFGLPIEGVALAWDSRAAGADRFGLGAGWGLGLGSVGVEGGVWVYPASGGVLPADASSPSGLAGYTLADLRFEQAPGVLPPRGPGDQADRSYSFVLHELGGTTTYFDAAGDPVAQLTATGRRTDWAWQSGPRDAHRLTSVTDADGVVTSLEWNEAHQSVLVRRGANLPGGGEPWTIRLDHGRVTGTTDPLGGRVEVTTDAAGMVTGVSGVSGSRTEIEWRPHTDGTLRVDRLVTSGIRDDAWSTRSWRPAGAALPSGWPVVDATLTGFAGGALTSPIEGHATVVGDGDTEVESTYNARGSLVRRVTSGATGSGRRVLQEQTFSYPGTDEHGTPTSTSSEPPAAWSRPSEATITFRDEHGGERSTTQHTEYDEFGRLAAQTGVDGVTTTYTYDPGAVDGSDDAVPPVGLLTSERRVAADGLVEEVRHELNEARTAVIVSTEYAGRVDGDLTVAGRTEYAVEPDGFVSERRDHPAPDAGPADAIAGGAAAVAPRVTRWARSVDLSSGTITVDETVAADTSAALSTSSTSSLAHGGELTATDPTGLVTTTAYDRLGRVVAVTDEAGRATTTAYETPSVDGRNAVTVTGPDGVATTELRDEFGRVVRIVDNIHDGRVETGYERVVESREYPAPGVVRSADAWGAVSSKRVDMFGRTLELTAPNGLRTTTEYHDVDGTVTSGVTPSGRIADAPVTSTTTMDASGRAVTSTGTRADGAQVSEVATTYDGFGRPVESTGGPVAASTTYDARGSVTDQRFEPTSADADPADADPAGSDADRAMAVSHEFDRFGSSTRKTVSDATASYAGVARSSDVLGRTVAETDQAGVTSTTSYTPDGLIAAAVTSTGQQRTYSYDEQTRQLLESTVTAPGDEPVTTGYEYDPATGRVSTEFDPADREGTELTYEYDAFGNTTSVTYPDGAQVSHEFDEHGRRVSTTDITGATTRYDHDQAGLLTSATQTAADGDPLATIAYTYDAYGRLLNAARGNGQTTAYEYNAVNDLTRETTTLDGAVTADRSYTYDQTGRLTQRTDRTRDGQPFSATTTTYAYDAFNRLTGSTIHDGDTADSPVTSSTAYTVTVAGDLADETVTTDPGTDREQTTRRVFEYSPSGALTAITTTDPGGTARVSQEYDADGNLVRDLEGTAYSYDASNRVTSRTGVDGVTTRTSYWADGSRHALTADAGAGASTTFYWDGDTLVNDAHTGTSADSDDDAGTASYLIGAIRHARTVTSGHPDRPDHRTSYLGTDRHGNTTDLTDELGQVTTRYSYTDYGTTTETSVAGEASTPRVGDATRNPFQYAAGHTDPSGDQHLRTRAYDADTARFTTPDPAPMLTDYAYAGLNPITNVDPSGRAEIGDYIINGALIGVALITGAFAATSIGLPTGGMSYGAYAAWTVGLFAVIGDVASTGIAIAEIVHDAGVRFMTDEQREILRISGTVIGAVSAVAGPIAAGIKRRYAAEDDNAWNIAFNRPNQKFDTSPVRAHQLEALLPRHVARLFGKKFEYHLDTLSSHFASSKEKLRKFARSFETGEVSEVEAYDFWFAKTDDVDFNFAFEEITRFARNDVQGGLKGAQAAKRAVDAAIKAIKEDKKTIDKVMSKWLVYKTAYRDAPIDLFPAE